MLARIGSQDRVLRSTLRFFCGLIDKQRAIFALRQEGNVYRPRRTDGRPPPGGLCQTCRAAQFKSTWPSCRRATLRLSGAINIALLTEGCRGREHLWCLHPITSVVGRSL